MGKPDPRKVPFLTNEQADAVDRTILAKDYFLFIRRFWEVIEPETDLSLNWHVEFLADLMGQEVERVALKKPRVGGDLIVNIPPRSMKSYVMTIFLNAWAWTRYPWLKFITTSFNANLATEHAGKTRRIIQSGLYQRLWGHVYRLRPDQNKITWFENDQGGIRRTAGTGGGITGSGADILTVDDPTNPGDIGDASLAETVSWWDTVAYSRLNDPKVGVRVVVMQRIHERDLTGHLLERARVRKSEIRRVIIPADDSFPPHPPELAKRYRGGLFWPERFGRDVLAEYRLNMGSTGYANQYGQSPSPADGIIFKREWFRRYDPDAVDFSGETWRHVQTWDLAFKDGDDSALNAGQTWSSKGSQYYLRPGMVVRKMEYVAQRQAVLDMKKAFPLIHAVLVEDASNAQAILSDLKGHIPGLIALPKRGGKVESAMACSPIVEAGQVWVPHGPEGDDFIAYLTAFPRGRYKDPVDAFTLFLNWSRQKGAGRATISGIGRNDTGDSRDQNGIADAVF